MKLSLHASRYTLHASRNCPLHLSRVLYKSPLYMQNKPNFRKSQMNVNLYNTTDYENKSNWKLGENKPNTNPIQTQSKPIQSQLKPIKCQNKPNSKPIKANFKRQTYSNMKPKFLNFLLKNPADTKNPPKNLMPAHYDLFTNKFLAFLAEIRHNN